MNEKTQKIYGGFTRLRNFPLDSTTVFEKFSDLVKYLVYNRTAYEGQICTVNASDPQHGVYLIVKDYNTDELTYKRLADDVDVIKNAEDIAVLFRDLEDKHSQIEVNKQNIETLTSRIDNDYVTNTKLNQEIQKILGDEYESLSGNLNDIVEISRKINELLLDLETKISSEEVRAAFAEYVIRFNNIENDISTLSLREDQDVSAIKGRLNVVEAQIADILPRILSEEDVLQIVGSRGLYNVLKVHDFTFTPTVCVDRNQGFTFKPGDIIHSITVKMTISSNTTGEFVPYLENLDGTNTDDDIIDDAAFVVEKANKADGYCIENIDYEVEREGYFAINTPSSFSQGKGTIRIEYFRKG